MMISQNDREIAALLVLLADGITSVYETHISAFEALVVKGHALCTGHVGRTSRYAITPAGVERLEVEYDLDAPALAALFREKRG